MFENHKNNFDQTESSEVGSEKIDFSSMSTEEIKGKIKDWTQQHSLEVSVNPTDAAEIEEWIEGAKTELESRS